jgi:septal ring factor EnvC (AmiA/AmiB activator)
VALADTIKILNDDEALELFKKTLPSSSLLQTRVSSVQARTSAIRALSASHGPRVDLVALALRSKSANFDKVVKMIDDMVTLLGKEQTADDDKKTYCEKNFDTTEDEAKRLSRETADLEHAIEEGENMISTLKDEIKSLADGIAALDKSVAEATETRKEEHKNYVETIASDNAAKELLAIAKNRLNKFYNPKLYKAPPKRELSEEDRITVNLGGTLAPTAAPGGIGGTGVTVFAEAAPPPPPAAVAAYSKKSEESTGVIAMVDLLVSDLDKEINEMGVEEKNSQAEYESFMKDSAEKRAADSAAMTDKEGAKADAEAALQKNSADKKSTVAEAMANAEEISALHGECDWLISNFEARKEARAGEVESLKNAKAVLAGADYSFAEIGSVRKH